MQTTERLKPSERVASSASHRARIAYLRDLRERIFAALPAMRHEVEESSRVARVFARASVFRAKPTWVPQGPRGDAVERRDSAIADLQYALGALEGAAEQMAALESELPGLLAAEEAAAAARERIDDALDWDAESPCDLLDAV
jgi:hypothetical protein